MNINDPGMTSSSAIKQRPEGRLEDGLVDRPKDVPKHCPTNCMKEESAKSETSIMSPAIMVVDDHHRALAVDAISAIEKQSFGAQAWSRAAVEQELNAPDRTYVLLLEKPNNQHCNRQSSKHDNRYTALKQLHGVSHHLGCHDHARCNNCETLAQGLETVVGYAGFWFDGDDAQLMSIAVLPTRRKNGYATLMLHELLRTAARKQTCRMLLEVSVLNDAALRLYTNFGFERIGLRKRYYNPGGIDAYTMSLDVADYWHRKMNEL